jgi:ABC-2 type transport system permease protein
MRRYLAILSTRFRSNIQYRLAAVAGLATQIAWGFIRIMVLVAFYSSGEGSSPMSIGETVTYIWLGQATLGLIPWGVDKDALDHVRTGTLAYELVRPISLYPHWFVRALGWRVAGVSLRSVPLVLFAGVAMPFLGMGEWALRFPTDPPAILAWLGSLAVAALMSAAITMFGNLTLFITIMPAAGFILPTLFSGMVIPLPLFPDSWQPFLRALPYRYLSDVPNRIFAGHIPVHEAGIELLLGVAWLVLLTAAGAAFARWAVSRVVVQGG